MKTRKLQHYLTSCPAFSSYKKYNFGNYTIRKDTFKHTFSINNIVGFARATKYLQLYEPRYALLSRRSFPCNTIPPPLFEGTTRFDLSELWTSYNVIELLFLPIVTSLSVLVNQDFGYRAILVTLLWAVPLAYALMQVQFTHIYIQYTPFLWNTLYIMYYIVQYVSNSHCLWH